MAVQRKSGGRPLVGGVGISSPQRVIDRASGATKIALAEYYLSVAAWLVPHLAGRPLSMVRAPEGVGSDSFFQRHCGRLKMPHMRAAEEPRSRACAADPGGQHHRGHRGRADGYRRVPHLERTQ